MTAAGSGWRRPQGIAKVIAGALSLVCAAIVAGCGVGSSGNGSAPGDPGQPLAQTAWCDQPAVSFQNDATAAQPSISEWSAVRSQLGFTPYLPASLPQGSCLVLAGGTVHDPVYGAHLQISYSLPKIGPVSFSEAPERSNIPAKVQCVASSQDAHTTICMGAIKSTSITIASRQSASEIKKLFASLQADVPWMPAANATATPATPSANTPAASPATGTPSSTPAGTATAGSGN